MLGDTITVTYNTVAKVLSRVKLEGYGANYYLDDTTKRFYVNVKHTVPVTGQSGESHLVRLDVEHITSDEVVRKTSAWTVIRTDVGIQEATSADYTTQALVDFLSDATIDKVIGRES